MQGVDNFEGCGDPNIPTFNASTDYQISLNIYVTGSNNDPEQLCSYPINSVQSDIHIDGLGQYYFNIDVPSSVDYDLELNCIMPCYSGCLSSCPICGGCHHPPSDCSGYPIIHYKRSFSRKSWPAPQITVYPVQTDCDAHVSQFLKTIYICVIQNLSK